MKYAVLADVHANLAALEAVMKDIDHGKVDELWCLGDLVGYGPDPAECINLIRQYCSFCVAGNHDWAAAGKISTEYFNPEAAYAARWTTTKLAEDDIQYLAMLPLKINLENFSLVHGSPREPIWEYVLSTNVAEENLRFLETSCCFLGHSHVPLVFECQDSCTLRRFEVDVPLNLSVKRLFVNPGSVGQPRDRDPRASYAIFDNNTNQIVLYKVPYDISAVQRRMAAAALPRSLIERLKYGA